MRNFVETRLSARVTAFFLIDSIADQSIAFLGPFL